jgi:ribulose-phosphate 3-epimerase
MPKLIPAILTDDPNDLTRKIRVVEKMSDEAHIDFMDGEFVETVSIHPQTLLASDPKINLEAHLMVKRPDLFVLPFRETQVGRIIFHIEAVDNLDFLIGLFKDEGFQVGLAINPETPVEVILPHLSEIDLIHFLGVHPGRQGNAFMPSVLEKIRSLREIWSSGTISVDGGIKLDNIESVASTRVDRIVVGSALWQSANPEKAFRELKAKII